MIDIGANLADAAFDGDRAAVIERARAAGVEAMVVTGTTVGQSRRAVEVARSANAEGAGSGAAILFATVGVHPHHAKDFLADTTGQLAAIATAPEVVAIGETGLDFYRELSPRDAQEAAMHAQLELAVRLGLPVFLHERDAAERFLSIVAQWRDRLGGGVLHCFTGSRATLRASLDLDLHIGITGWICDERRGGELAAMVGDIPDDRLLIETDAPYLLPHTLRPRPKTRRNEPQWLGAVCSEVARQRRVDAGHVARVTEANARRLFRLDRR